MPLIGVVLSLISGVFVPVDQLPSRLAEVGRILPLYHLAAGLQTALATGGPTLHAGNLAVLCAWGLWGTVFAARRFSWEPRAATA
jgi:ABC-type polysaccharide/polyol phosphate export permease